MGTFNLYNIFFLKEPYDNFILWLYCVFINVLFVE